MKPSAPVPAALATLACGGAGNEKSTFVGGDSIGTSATTTVAAWELPSSTVSGEARPSTTARRAPASWRFSI